MAWSGSQVDVFTGDEWHLGATAEMNDAGHLSWQGGQQAFERPMEGFSHRMLVPAFVDLQVYGRGGRMFSQYPDAASLEAMDAAHRKHATVAALVTIATLSEDQIFTCLHALRKYCEKGRGGILGLHLEGPFIHPNKRGAHRQEWVMAPNEAMVQRMLEAAGGWLKMVTLAPECCSDRVLQLFADAGVVISAGHTTLGFEEGLALPERGISLVTHLFNAMEPLHHRQPGLPAAAMAALNASIIPDGLHVHPEMVRLAKARMGERLFFITDAVTDCHEGPYRHQYDGRCYRLPDGTLSGSAIYMTDAVWAGVHQLGFGWSESLRMVSRYPAAVMGLAGAFGSLQQHAAMPVALLEQGENGLRCEAVWPA